MFNYDDFASFIVRMQQALENQGQEKQEAFNNALIVWTVVGIARNQM